MKSVFDYYLIRAFRQDKYHNGHLRVSRRTPRLWDCVDQFAMYLRRERGYDFPLFDVHSDGTGVAPYLFGDGASWLGACALHETESAHILTEIPWILEWIWLHPYARRDGLLTKAWPQLESEHGQFLIRAPLSQAMEAFINKQGVDLERVVC